MRPPRAATRGTTRAPATPRCVSSTTPRRGPTARSTSPRPSTSTSSSRCRASSGPTPSRTACCPTCAASSTRSRTSASSAAPTTCEYLRERYDALVANPLFASMEFIDDRDEFARRLPLMADGRDFSEPVALNWTQDGTDVDFGALSRQLIGFGAQQGHGHAVRPRGAQPAARTPTAPGRSRSSTAAPARSARSTPSSCSSAPAAARCRCCRRPASRKPRASVASRSAGSACAPAIRS